ncbi:E3 ubiquitin-protein ligase bre1 [Blastomyces dermatitidis]|uniref:E3 ubiquitin protein ligase n=3 Tax=Blastomyces TaxID=229219 RepID=A0A179UZ17_BLAGS|nr:E3 ubiquitin-protein ligase bre1 [Blastomyces gilchristii SLH14081]XP_031580349.1 E3 ubiquitin-protein ligase bre1, variant [Blastomyces gilchristii SLH14081]XP_045276929.1 E3 ubiquitin-protein ligase bre1 [Blastomyces dermatitidis ER-3]XP_045281200.1 E3 ubiquitin-protein ligase bre1, variant [Blastomyces dermatitidis ER-3]EGE83622.1 E3 ubiquitin-protein ligase bre1 [Blastomyces dermatitidis ATCC 18188]EQL34623.1 E3 ubiquitin-protein ligase bre1 [Blastomyces dermatitidis ATCC 26199]EEQ9014
MPAVEASTVPLAESGLVVKMEDRKRPAAYDPNESTPPLKKQATSLNGGAKPHPDTDMPWKDDLERFQKDAILRQMQEYKREKSSLEARLKELTKATEYHNDHLRIIDAWFKQLIDEVKVIVDSSDNETQDKQPFPSALLFADHDNFEKHLQARSDDIKATISKLFSRPANVSAEVTHLQGQLAKKLAEEKVAIAELEKSVTEKQQLEERLDAASLRYMVAEKKIDRARSLTVARLEKQYILGAQRPGGDNSSVKREDSSSSNGVGDSSDRVAELEEGRNRAVAILEKQKEQLEKLEAENSKLLTQVTELNMKFSKLSDEDYAHTDLFKQLKSQHEDVIKRINHLEATNVQLREEAEKLQAERNAYRIQIENESQVAVGEKEAQLAKTESDLARIRNARDELLADQQMRKAAQEQERTSICQTRELLDAKESRISALESEIERLQLQIEGIKDKSSSIEDLPLEDLRVKYQTLEKQYEMLNTELASMQTAFTKTSKLASQKLADLNLLEEKVQRLTAEKSKADQKYFAAMKSKEARDAELRSLRIQNMKSSDIVSQLKEAETTTRSLVSNVEKQLTETKETLTNTMSQYYGARQQLAEADIVIQGLNSQVTELKKQIVTKDSSLSSATSACRKAETEVEGLKATLADTKKSLESWRNKGLGNSSSEYEMLRSLALCTVCRRNFKNTVIKTCGHVFCKECVEERLTSRSRKCPNCNKSFGSNDYMHITL